MAALDPSETMFRRLTIGDARALRAIAAPGAPGADALDARTAALLRIAALVAIDAPESAYRAAVGAAESAGVGLGDLLAVLGAVAGSVGDARIISAAPRIAIAAGYDVEAALESPGSPGGRLASGAAIGAR